MCNKTNYSPAELNEQKMVEKMPFCHISILNIILVHKLEVAQPSTITHQDIQNGELTT